MNHVKPLSLRPFRLTDRWKGSNNGYRYDCFDIEVVGEEATADIIFWRSIKMSQPKMNEVMDDAVSSHSYENNMSCSTSSIESSSCRERMHSEGRLSELKMINKSLTYAVQVRLLLASKQSVISITCYLDGS